MSRLRLALVLGALVLLGCGSSESGGLSFGKGTGGVAGASGGSGGISWATGGNLSLGGASPGAGGIVNGGASNGGASNGGASNGGTGSGGTSDGGIASGGTSDGGASNGGTMSGGDTGAGGISLDSGVRVDGGRPVAFPSGGVISQQCADCATANCQAEARICEADQACWDMGLCVTRCIIPLQCAVCFAGTQQARTEFTALQCCTTKHCSMCPSLGGLLACP